MSLGLGTSAASVKLAPDDAVFPGVTAASESSLDRWNGGNGEHEGEFANLSRPITHESPGKLAYAISFRKEVSERK